MDEDRAEELAKDAIVCVGRWPTTTGADSLDVALKFVELWPKMLYGLSFRATEASPANFVSSLQRLNAELCQHRFLLRSDDERLTRAAKEAGNRVNIDRREYRSATAAAYEIANRLLNAICEVMNTRSIPEGFNPEMVATPNNWPACRVAARQFFCGELSDKLTFLNLADAIAKERLAVLAATPEIHAKPELRVAAEISSAEQSEFRQNSSQHLDGTDQSARHAIDFASVYWFGVCYVFTPNQAACVRVLWEAWENRTPSVGRLTIIDQVGVDRSDERLDLVFRNHPAWNTMIISPSKGRYSLNVPIAND
jgi:hypothetical protein